MDAPSHRLLAPQVIPDASRQRDVADQSRSFVKIEDQPVEDLCSQSRIGDKQAAGGDVVGRKFANTNLSSNVEDLMRAANCLREHYAAPALLIGHSLGGMKV